MISGGQEKLGRSLDSKASRISKLASCWNIQDSKNQGKHPECIDTVAAMLWRTPIFEAWPGKNV